VSIFDEHPFPFHRPEAQELMRVLAGLFRTYREALLFTEPFGVDPLLVVPELNAINLWHDILGTLASKGTARAATAKARALFPGNPRAAFLDALLADAPAPLSAEPLSDHGPGFDDSVSTPEALLFFDDLTMPMGQVQNLVSTLNRLASRAEAVCLLRVRNAHGTFFGTGFRIAPSLVLTNHHVLFPKGAVATNVNADFGFDVDAHGTSLPVTSLTGDVATIKGEMADDWAVIEIPGMQAAWPAVPLDEAPAPKVGDFAYILQHPGGQQKRLGFVRNMITEVEDGVIRYLTDTEPGSSGAPVFDAGGRIIALHHRGGRPVEVVGKPPVAKNEGVRISRVLTRMKSQAMVA
jgi:S1-C subfamily serine protease